MLNGDYRAQQEIERVYRRRGHCSLFFFFFSPIGVFCGNNLAGRLKLGCGFGGMGEVARQCSNRKSKLKRVHNEIKLIEISPRNATNCVSMSFNEL